MKYIFDSKSKQKCPWKIMMRPSKTVLHQFINLSGMIDNYDTVLTWSPWIANTVLCLDGLNCNSVCRIWCNGISVSLPDYLVLPTGGVAGLPLHRVIAHLRRLLVLGHGVVSPGDTDRVGGQSHSLHPHWGDHGSTGVWHGSGVFIKEMEKVILRWVYGVWRWPLAAFVAN